MWEFYLASSEMAFRESDMVVFQIQMAKHKGVVPQTRDYIGLEEARLRGLEATYSPPANSEPKTAKSACSDTASFCTAGSESVIALSRIAL